jgi:hypothetical protein
MGAGLYKIPTELLKRDSKNLSEYWLHRRLMRNARI